VSENPYSKSILVCNEVQLMISQPNSPQLLAQPDAIDSTLESHNSWVVSLSPHSNHLLDKADKLT
jgi:hypothetical protein